jgi:peptidoglycan LD-endopeptidase CwlK
MIFNRIDTNKLYQPFFKKLVLLAANCAARGNSYVAISGFRSHAEQDVLYAQGRTTPGKIITQAKGGQSYHNFGVAVDWALDKDSNKPGLQPSWTYDDYKILAEEAEKLGLEAGYRWKFQDPPHIQIAAAKLGISFKTLEAEYIKGGMPAVFAYLDKFKI